MSNATFATNAQLSDAKATAKQATANLRVGEPNDHFEQEADRVANEIMASGAAKQEWSLSRMSIDAPLQRKCGCGGSGGATGECEECKEKEKQEKSNLQRKASGPRESAVAPPIVHEVLNSPGHPLDRVTRDFFNARFGHDFSRVRVHTDLRAGNSAKAVGVHAYTVGNDIVFDSGQYSPASVKGRKLLAHELAHTIQQRPVLSRQPDPLNRPLPPHDPSPRFAPTGACYGSAICRDLITPSKLLAHAAEDPQNKEKREHRKKVCQKKPPDAACTAEGHGSVARETTKLLKGYDPSRPARGAKLIVDKDLESDFKASTMRCRDFVPPTSGTECITVPDETEKQAAQFNNTMDPTIGGEERGKWRERMVEILVHESEHTRFRAAFRAGGFPEATQQDCATKDTLAAMNELAAMLTEFPIRMERIRTSVGLSPEDRQKELEEWRTHRILGKEQSITVSLRTARCACNCEDADKMIRETVGFTTASWTQQQKNELHRELRDPRWSSLDLRWPFVAPAIPSVGRPDMQRKAAGPAASDVAPPIVHEVLNSPGQPLDKAPRTQFERGIGHDLSKVRIHTDGKAAESAGAVNALAYTVGNDVVFGHGQYNPGTRQGGHLLAHELAHTVQQQRTPGGSLQRKEVCEEEEEAAKSKAVKTKSPAKQQAKETKTPVAAEAKKPEEAAAGEVDVRDWPKKLPRAKRTGLQQRITKVPHELKLAKTCLGGTPPTEEQKKIIRQIKINRATDIREPWPWLIAAAAYNRTIKGPDKKDIKDPDTKGGYKYGGEGGKQASPQKEYKDPKREELNKEFYREGQSISAINTYDNAWLTLGRGLTGAYLSRAMEEFFQNDPKARDMFLDLGAIFADGKLLVVNTDNGAVEEDQLEGNLPGMDARKLFALSEPLLTLYKHVAESEVHAKFLQPAMQKQEAAAGLAIPQSVIDTWSDVAAIKLAGHLILGAGLRWTSLEKCNGSVREILRVYAKLAVPEDSSRGGARVVGTDYAKVILSMAGGKALEALEAITLGPDFKPESQKGKLLLQLSGTRYMRMTL